MKTMTLRLMEAIGLMMLPSKCVNLYFHPANASIIGWSMEIDSLLISEHTPRARNMPVSVVMKGGTFR